MPKMNTFKVQSVCSGRTLGGITEDRWKIEVEELDATGKRVTSHFVRIDKNKDPKEELVNNLRTEVLVYRKKERERVEAWNLAKSAISDFTP